jgi:hypothetical protein
MTPPNAVELMETARGVLLEQLMPALPKSLHYECRMIASAMAMACREINLAPMAEQLEEQRLKQVLGIRSHASHSTQSALASLSQSIRRGEYDQPGDYRDTLLAALTEITRARLLISNPKALAVEKSA